MPSIRSAPDICVFLSKGLCLEKTDWSVDGGTDENEKIGPHRCHTVVLLLSSILIANFCDSDRQFLHVPVCTFILPRDYQRRPRRHAALVHAEPSAEAAVHRPE
jgi:hypothetical protein